MTARITLYTLLALLIGITPHSATPSSTRPLRNRQQYSQPVGPQRYTQQPAQRPAQSVAQPQGYRPATRQGTPPGASAIVPQNTPRLERKAPQTVNAPFRLTPAQQAEVDRVLKRWEEASKSHKRIVIEFNRFEGQTSVRPPRQAQHAHPHRSRQSGFRLRRQVLWSIRGEWVGSSKSLKASVPKNWSSTGNRSMNSTTPRK